MAVVVVGSEGLRHGPLYKGSMAETTSVIWHQTLTVLHRGGGPAVSGLCQLLYLSVMPQLLPQMSTADSNGPPSSLLLGLNC